MSQTRSLTCLPQAAVVLMSVVATWGLVYAVGEGDEIRFATDNCISFLTLTGVSAASFFFFLNTWFIPSEFARNVTNIFRVMRIVLSFSVLVMLIGAVGLLNICLIVTVFEFKRTLLILALLVCIYIGKYGLYLSCLTVLVGGVIGIAIDLSVLASRIRLPKANFR